MAIYSYKMRGTDRHGFDWMVEGVVGDVTDFTTAAQLAMEHGFTSLTQGRAVYGNPGVTCQGPYTVMKMEIERQ